MPSVAAGSRWTARRGRHAGVEVEIERVSDANQVVFHHVGAEGVSWNGDKSDGRQHRVPADEFLLRYKPKEAEVGNGVARAFRQNNSKIRVRKIEQVLVDPEQEAREILGQDPVKNGFYVNPGTTDLGITVEMVTPAMAQAWLDNGGINRKMSERRVLRYMAAIQIGEWEITGETIKLGENGKLRDGQHRLTAIVHTGITVPCIIVRGVKETAFDKIDTGGARNMSDVLSMHGHLNHTALAAAVRGLIIIERYGRYDAGRVKVGSAAPPSNAQGLAYIEAHPEVADAVRLADTVRKEGHFVGGTGLWAIALTMFLRISDEQARVFAHSLVQGANLEAESPILRLRNMYQGRARDWNANTEARERLLAIIIKAWNFWRRDELVSVLTWHSAGRAAERFPVAE